MAERFHAFSQTTVLEIVGLRFELFVRDRERSVEFYQRALGFEREPLDDSLSSDYIQIVNGGVCIGLCPMSSLADDHYFRARSAEHPGVGVEMVFEVYDILKYQQRAQSADAVFEPICVRPWGRRDLRLVDPDGYYIRVTEALDRGFRG